MNNNNNNKVLIPFNDRPKQKFLKNNIQILSNSELLSIIMNPNCKYLSDIEIFDNIIKEVGEIKKFQNMTFDELRHMNALNRKNAIILLSAIEFGRRVYECHNYNRIKLNTADKVYEYLKYELKYKTQEHFYALYLDSKKSLIEKKLLFVGTLNKTITHPREIFKYAYLLNASSIICVHNHPSGDVEPSKDDYITTRNLIDIGRLHGIEISDHIIIGDGYYSFYESGKI